jgi:hypothetical protein
MCYLYDFARSLGMSLTYALAFLSALSFELSATSAFCIRDRNTFIIESIR